MRRAATSRASLIALVLVFLLSRGVSSWFAGHPDSYDAGGIVPASDVERLYQSWADALVTQGQEAYSEVPIEYPPGSLPFIVGPKLVASETPYLHSFIALMLLVDLAGLLGLWLIARRWKTSWGPWLWVLLLPALGPTVYLRLDLVPAVATIWAIERAAARDWFGSGGWLGFGIIAKLYPVLFLPAAVIAAGRRWKLLLGTGLLIALALLPLISAMDGFLESVFGYHTERGIQVESLWGSILFLVLRRGGEVSIEFNFGALHFAGPVADALKPVSSVASVISVGAASLLAFGKRERRAETLAEVSFVILALALSFGSVFSPQFLIWLFALGACVIGIPDTPLRKPALALIPIALMTQAIFPYFYNQMLAAETGPVALLLIRNLSVLAVGLTSAWWLFRRDRATSNGPSTAALASG